MLCVNAERIRSHGRPLCSASGCPLPFRTDPRPASDSDRSPEADCRTARLSPPRGRTTVSPRPRTRAGRALLRTDGRKTCLLTSRPYMPAEKPRGAAQAKAKPPFGRFRFCSSAFRLIQTVDKFPELFGRFELDSALRDRFLRDGRQSRKILLHVRVGKRIFAF